ncbi:MAG: TonB-dependent receptor [Bacteroidetes bacterium]|nr:TonB-dependent receptor [Bacteroidota bacterium]
MAHSFPHLLLLWLFAHGLCAQTVVLRGQVQDEHGQPLPGVQIELHETHQGALTDALGHFLLPGVRVAAYHLHVELAGYRPLARTLSLADSLKGKTSGADTLTLQLVLAEVRLELDAMRVEADKLKLEARRQSVAVFQADEQWLRRSRGSSLMHTLGAAPGFAYMSTGTGIAKPVIRGLAFNRVAVVQYGLRQEGQQWGQDHGVEIDPYDAQQVQILRGPATLVYGPEAIGGVVELLPGPEVPDHHLRTALEMGYQSVNRNRIVSGEVAAHRGRWVGRLRLSDQNYGDYYLPAASFTYNRFVLPLVDGQLKNTAGRERHAAGMLGYHGKWGHTHVHISSYDQEAGLFMGAVGMPTAYALRDDGNDRDVQLPAQHTRHYKVVSNTSLLLGRQWLDVDLGYQYNHRQELSLAHAHGRPAAGGSLAHELRLATLSGNIRLHHRWLKGSSGVVGFSGMQQQNRRDGFEFLLAPFQSWQIGVFAYQQWALCQDKLYLNGGARLDAGQLQVQSFRSYFIVNNRIDSTTQYVPALYKSFQNLSGSGGLSWFLRPWLNLKANVGTYFRFPQAYELTANGIHHGTFRHEQGDPALEVERGVQADLAVVVQRKMWAVSLTPFYNYFANYIYLAAMPEFSRLPDGDQVYRFRQSPAYIGGGELTADWHPGKHLHLGGAYMYLHGQNVRQYLPLPFMPPNRLQLEAELHGDTPFRWLKDLFFRLQWQKVDAQHRTDRNERATPGYTLLNLGMGCRVQVHGQALEWTFLLNNALDERYFHHLSRYRFLNLPEPGRNIVLQLRMPLEWKLPKPAGKSS